MNFLKCICTYAFQNENHSTNYGKFDDAFAICQSIEQIIHKCLSKTHFHDLDEFDQEDESLKQNNLEMAGFFRIKEGSSHIINILSSGYLSEDDNQFET